MTLSAQFRTWALDPARTGDELYTAELFVEAAQAVRDRRQKIYARDFEATRKRQKRRKLNPAYRPVLSPAALDLVGAEWGEIKELRNGADGGEDRPVSDLAALQFFPQLTGIELISELSDLGALVGLRELSRLKLRDETLVDLGALAELPGLTEVSLDLGAPGPAAGALGALPALKTLSYRGNLLALQDVGALPVVERAWLRSHWQWSTPVREGRDLPTMPKVRWLSVDGVAGLRGIERCARLRELDVCGPFADLGPLAELGEVRTLRLGGERFFDLAPVARMPRLRTLELEREHGLDLAPLADSPSLRQVLARRCAVLATELGTLNAALGLVDEASYRLAEPRALGSVRWFRYDPQRADFRAGRREASDDRDPRKEGFGDDPLPAPAEGGWFAREVALRLGAFLAPGWGRLNVWVAGRGELTLRRYQDILHVGEVVTAVRQTAAAARYPWEILLVVEPHGDLSEDLEELEARDGGGETCDSEPGREEGDAMQQRRREHREFLEREHRWRLQQQDGRPIDPAAFFPPAPAPAGASPGDAEADDDDADAEEGAGDDRFGADAGFTAVVAETTVWVHESGAQNAAEFFGVVLEDWHALAEPPEQRPRPA
jgi:hypothetical protein